MFAKLKNLLGIHQSDNLEDDDPIQDAANLVGYFMGDERQRKKIADNLIFAMEKSAETISGTKDFDYFINNANEQKINECAYASEIIAAAFRSEKGGEMIADCFSTIQVLCLGRLGRYKKSKNKKIYEMAAELAATALAAEKIQGNRKP